MPAPIIPPQPVPYIGSINAQTAVSEKTAPEGRKTIPISIFWATDAGSNLSIKVNVRSAQIQTISKIQTLYVDNLRCSAQVTIYFPDTQFVVDIPAFAEGFFPVVTAGLEFFIWAQAAVDTDQTNVNILNYFLPPGIISTFAFSDTDIFVKGAFQLFNTINLPAPPYPATSSLTLSPALTEGVITSFEVLADSIMGVGNPLASFAITDVAMAQYYWSSTLTPGGEQLPPIVLGRLTDLALPFNNGLMFSVTVTSPSNPNSSCPGKSSINLYWRMPK